MATQEHTLYEVRKGGAAWITLNRPEKRNALSGTMTTEVFDHVQAAIADSDVRCIVITGAGQGFCSGADLKNPPGQAKEGGRAVAYPDTLTAIWNSPKPVICAVNGAAFAGGLGLVAASDIIVASQEAIFSYSEVKIGVIPAIISVVGIRKLGTHQGMRLLLTGERFNGQQAVEYGLAHVAVPLDQLESAVQKEVDQINLGGPIAVAECKKLVRTVPELSLEEGFKLTGEWSLRMFKSDEAAEGMAAFREKRKPNWIKE